MASTYTDLLYHIVFSTRIRKPSIDDALRPRLFAYLGGVVKRIGGHPLAIGGVADHVHLLIALPADTSIATAVRLVKANSSKWIHESQQAHASFAWQRGYGAFSVSRSQVETVRRYVERQPEHHRKRSFQAEYLVLLRKHEIAFDERYLWS